MGETLPGVGEQGMATIEICTDCGHQVRANQVGEYAHQTQRDAFECFRRHGARIALNVGEIDGEAFRQRTLRRMAGWDK
jgi:hypothetical protein